MPNENGPTTGERNRNYLNVKNNLAKPWQGIVGTDDRGHAIFSSAEWGLRAAIMTLRTYWFSYGLRTTSGILGRWAPPTDTIGSLAGNKPNDPTAYSNFVAGRTRISAGHDLQLFHPDKRLNNVANLQALVQSMAEYENYNGFIFPPSEFVKAVYLMEPDRAPQAEPAPPASAPAPVDPVPPLPPAGQPLAEEAELLAQLTPLLAGYSAVDLLRKLIGLTAERSVPLVRESPTVVTPADIPPPQPAPPAAAVASAPLEKPPHTPLKAVPVGGFPLTDSLLRKIFRVCGFVVPDDELVFFGLRGALPGGVAPHEFSVDQLLMLKELNYKNPRCTLGIWKPTQGLVAVFPGSTIPTSKYVLGASLKNGDGTNELMPGFYSFEKGEHRAGTDNGHKAFRQVGSRIFRRTADDAIYEPTDRTEAGNPFDNLHAAFTESLSGEYSSAGCQVVVGKPKSKVSVSETGAWKTFRNIGYGIPQSRFRYLLFTANSASILAEDIERPVSLKLHCGAESDGLPDGYKNLIQDAQTKLGLTDPDGKMGAVTALAILKHQREIFGATLADAVLGPQTGASLELLKNNLNPQEWPKV